MLGISTKGPVYKLPRKTKALMIEAVLTANLGSPPAGLRILDIGCGNGDISQHFANLNEQFGVDTEDKRRAENDGFEFKKVASERLPYEDAFFDIVISNHVIEHVPNQTLHLSEMRRVLKEGGIAYLATPNKTSPIMQGHVGNELVLPHSHMRSLFERSGFSVREYSVDVLKSPRRFHAEIRGLAFLPRAVLSMFRPWFPSHIFVLEPTPRDNRSERF
jgi:SAM-dependent methyltransferase